MLRAWLAARYRDVASSGRALARNRLNFPASDGPAGGPQSIASHVDPVGNDSGVLFVVLAGQKCLIQPAESSCRRSGRRPLHMRCRERKIWTFALRRHYRSDRAREAKNLDTTEQPPNLGIRGLAFPAPRRLPIYLSNRVKLLQRFVSAEQCPVARVFRNTPGCAPPLTHPSIAPSHQIHHHSILPPLSPSPLFYRHAIIGSFTREACHKGPQVQED
jgi:hypothetical protein